MVVRLRLELRLNLVRASGLFVMDCRFELLIPKESIKTEAITIELADNTISLCFLSLDKAELCRFNVPSGFGTMLSHRTFTYGSNGSLRCAPLQTCHICIFRSLLFHCPNFKDFYCEQARTVIFPIPRGYVTTLHHAAISCHTNSLFALIVEKVCAVA